MRCYTGHAPPVSSVPKLILVVAFLAMAVSVVRLHKHLLVYEVAGKSDGRDPETREGALEAVPPCKRACVSPRLTFEMSVCAIARREICGRYYCLAQGSFFGCPEAAANF